jgi:Putative zinc-finger
MCEYSGRLVAWLDSELPEDEATNVEWHVAHCAECRGAVSVYSDISDAFLGSYEAVMIRRKRSGSHRRVLAVAGALAAAATVILVLILPRPAMEQLSPHPLPAIHAPAMAFEIPKPWVQTATVRAKASPPAAAQQQFWFSGGPTVEVALPAEALFPPGAVPQGFSFIADVRPRL